MGVVRALWRVVCWLAGLGWFVVAIVVPILACIVPMAVAISAARDELAHELLAGSAAFVAFWLGRWTKPPTPTPTRRVAILFDDDGGRHRDHD